MAPDVRAEFPGLRLRFIELRGPVRPDSRGVEERLRLLSDRIQGRSVVTMRTQPIHHAYRSFFRQTGLDPDVQHTPAEQAAIARLLTGGLRARDPLSGALLIALVETGVAVWALDGDRVAPGGLGIRQTGDREELGSGVHRILLRAGCLVVADARHIQALLFEDPARGHVADRSSRRVVLFAVGVQGVPDVSLEEALWLAVEALTGGQ